MSDNLSLDRIETLLARPGGSHTVSLTSYRRNGRGVSTPVGMRAVAGKLYFMTPASSWKVRRLAYTPHVRLALCTFRGQTLSPATDGVARRLAGPEAKQARTWICAGFAGWVVNVLYLVRYPGDKTAVYEIALVTQKQQMRNPT